VYDPGLAEPNPPAVRVSFNIVDVKTGQVVIGARDIDPTSSNEKGSPVMAVGIKVPLDRFPAGSYRVDMQASDAAGAHSTTRTVLFDSE